MHRLDNESREEPDRKGHGTRNTEHGTQNTEHSGRSESFNTDQIQRKS